MQFTIIIIIIIKQGRVTNIIFNLAILRLN